MRSIPLDSWCRRAIARSALVALGALAFPLSAQQAQPPDQRQPSTRSAATPPRIWLTGGFGVGSTGPLAVGGGAVAVRGWSVAGIYSKSMSAGGSRLESYAEHRAVLVGRLLGAGGRRSLAIGIGRSKRWDVSYSACTGDWCHKDGNKNTEEGPAVVIAASARTRPLGGMLGLGVGLSAFLGRAAPAVGLNVTLDLGLLR